MTDRTVFQGARLIHRDTSISDEVALTVQGGTIIGVTTGGKSNSPPAGKRQSGDRVIDCRGRFISPGLVNLHAHSPMSIFRGIAEDVKPDAWFNREIWPYESRMDGDDVEAGACLAVAEMLDCGVTAFADHYFEASRICDVVIRTGIRADIAPTLFGMAGDFEKQLTASVDLIRNRKDENPRLALRLGPHSHYTCNLQQLAACAEAAGELGVGVHLHVEDGLEQIESSRALYGMTPMEVVSRAGLTGLPLIIGHAYWILDEERALIKEGNWIAVCMMSYMKLGMPPGPILDHPGSLPLCIGTDGAASSNCLNPLEQARLLALAGKSRQGNAETFSLAEIWGMLMRGHDALSFGTGRLDAGAPADLVVWNLDMLHTAPAYNPLAALIYSADARNAEHVMVAGELLKESGVLKLDTAEIVRNARARAEGILKKGKGATRLVF
jgi:5-methylthioadenosine/S-adenosylhomocysteine deaminase